MFVPPNPTFPIAKTAAMITQADLDAIIVDTLCAPQLENVLAGAPFFPLVLAPEADRPQFGEAVRLALNRADCPPLRRSANCPRSFRKTWRTCYSHPEYRQLERRFRDARQRLPLPARHAGPLPDRPGGPLLADLRSNVRSLGIRYLSRLARRRVRLLDGHGRSPGPGGVRQRKRPDRVVFRAVCSCADAEAQSPHAEPDAGPALEPVLRRALPRASAEAWQAAAPNSIVENLYGPTELTIACTVHRWNAATSPALCRRQIVPIGRPLPGLAALIVDDELRPVAAGGEGELCISGPQTTPGYWKDPRRTADRFVRIAMDTADERTFYRTGDRVQRLEGDEHIFLGRTDHQIKVLGHRVELGEVEAALRADPRVTEAVAIGWPVEHGSARGVVAFVSENGIDLQQIEKHARETLPAWAAPQRILIKDEFPLNANGKIDRRALAAAI